MVRLAPEICASRSEMAHPCRGSRASVVRISRSSVPCGRPVWGIGSIGPLVLRQEASASRVEVQHERDRIRRQRITRIVPDGWPRDSPFEIALATRSDRNHEWVREMMGPRRSKEQTHSIFQQPWGYHDSRLLVEKYIAWVAIARIPVSFANILVAVPRVVVAGIRCPLAPEFDPVDVEVVRVLIAVSRIIQRGSSIAPSLRSHEDRCACVKCVGSGARGGCRDATPDLKSQRPWVAGEGGRLVRSPRGAPNQRPLRRRRDGEQQPTVKSC